MEHRALPASTPAKLRLRSHVVERRAGGKGKGGDGRGWEGERRRGGGSGSGASSSVRSLPGLSHTASPELARRTGRHCLCLPQSGWSSWKRRSHSRGPPPLAGLGVRRAQGWERREETRAGSALPGSSTGLHRDRCLPAMRCPRPRPQPGRMSCVPREHGIADAVAPSLDMPVRFGVG